MKIKISKDIEILVFTGPESSGKTTCVERLIKKYQLPLVKEYAREYLTIHGSEYSFEDIQNIASYQTKNEVKTNKENPLIICDTDIVTLEIWALEKFGTSLGIKDELVEKKHYLICFPDIPWEPDPFRENPKDRMRLFGQYEKYLANLGVPYSILKKEDRNEIQFIV